jgi:phospholipid-translocating ATPase
VSNTKYNLLSFLPLVLYHQFKFFFNMFFLMITISQFFPALQVGFLFTYVAPLCFVITVTMAKEGFDDFVRWRRDSEINAQIYRKVTASGLVNVKSSRIKVGDLIEIKANQRIPADMVLLKTSDPTGSVFIRTDQLDGETDWKLRKASITCQRLETEALVALSAEVLCEQPHINIYSFIGQFSCVANDLEPIVEPLTLESTLWASTVLASGSCIGLVVYTGADTRSSMNSRTASSKIGVCDLELNRLAKFLFALMLILSLIIMCLNGFKANSHILLFRYVLLLSSIIPISLRVNLDMAKIFYCWGIDRDKAIEGTTARNSNIPEELGRIQILLTDKTGTLTKNEMTLKKLTLEHAQFCTDEAESLMELQDMLRRGFNEPVKDQRRNISQAVRDTITALALCHNVTPVLDESGLKMYQASSPDEIALVKGAEQLGVELMYRSQDEIVLRTPSAADERYQILQLFPFSSQSKRMGIVLRHPTTKQITFYSKGAEEVMVKRIPASSAEKVVEYCDNLAREGLRTLVVAQKTLGEEEYARWEQMYRRACAVMDQRDKAIEDTIAILERGLSYLCVTGVEDKLQDDVAQTIENMRTAGIKVWMLTGDKLETAKCIAIATRLKDREMNWSELKNISDPLAASEQLSALRFSTASGGHVLVVDGITLTALLDLHAKLFVEVASKYKAVVCCRVSPTQKTQIVEALKLHETLRICSIGDGGNDVGMIQSAHVGIGIEGKEGKQASLAADFSIMEFRSLNQLLLWHGRLSYQRTAKLSHFVFHRGLIISVIQALFTVMFYYCAIPIYNGVLMLGYTTFYTMMPVFALVLDEDVDVKSVMMFPPLYKTLQKGRALNFTMFAVWLWKSLFQGSVIILMSLLLFPDNNFFNITAITFTALILTELLNVYTEIEKFHWLMGVSLFASLVLYILSFVAMQQYFDLSYIFSFDFAWRVVLITALSWGPLHIAKMIKNKVDPSEHQKVMQAS